MRCDVCDAPSTGGQFCVTCGAPMRPALSAASVGVGTRQRARPAPGAWLARQEIRLVACPQCGAPNSAARWRCARCGAQFKDSGLGRQTDATAPGPSWQPTDESPAVQPESARWLALITAGAGVAVVAVAVMMLAARGVGPFAGADEVTAVTQARSASVDRVVATTATSDDGEPINLVDGDPATAWMFEDGRSDPQVELRLEQPVQIDHLLVWNGHQRSADTFHGTRRIRDVLIEFPDVDRGYTVEFPDHDANVRIDMPDPPVARTIRLTVQSTYGDGENDRVALSEIEALVATTSAP